MAEAVTRRRNFGRRERACGPGDRDCRGAQRQIDLGVRAACERATPAAESAREGAATAAGLARWPPAPGARAGMGGRIWRVLSEGGGPVKAPKTTRYQAR